MEDRTFDLRDTIKYTADGNTFFNLYIGNVPNSITEQDIRDYFSKYGNIKSVQLCSEIGLNACAHKFGHVNFEDAKSAGAALECGDHYMCNTKIQVQYADPCKQLNSGENKNYLGDPSDSKPNDPCASSIMLLNDDCLLHLYTFLTLHEQINLSESCLRFREIFKTLLHHEKCLEIDDDNVTLLQLENILDIAGEDLHQITVGWMRIDFPAAKSLQSITKMCPNLRELKFASVSLDNSAVFKEIGLKLPYLTKIEFPFCQICDDICQYLTLLQNVEYLDLSENNRVTGKYLANFPKLTHLNLRNCYEVQPSFFSNICEKGILKYLDIVNCYNLSTECYSRQLPKLKVLEELSVGNTEYPDEINEYFHLESLKALTIIRPSNDAFKNIVENHSEKLESLTIMGNCLDGEEIEVIYELKNLKKLCFVKSISTYDPFIENLCQLKQLNHLGLVYCNNFTFEALKKLFEQLSDINELDITGNRKLKNEDIVELAKIIKKKGRKSPCIIYTEDTNISKDIFKKEKYMEYAPFIAISMKELFWEMYVDYLDDSDGDSQKNNDSSSFDFKFYW